MLIIYNKNRRLWAALCPILLILSFSLCLLVGVIGGYASHPPENEIGFYWMAEGRDTPCGEENTATMYLFATPALEDICGGDVMAVLLEYEAADGWYLSSAEGIEAGRELTVTAGDGSLLLDGVLHFEEGDARLVKTEWKRREGRKTAFSVTWQAALCRLYVKGPDGAVVGYEISVWSENPPDGGTPEVSQKDLSPEPVTETVSESDQNSLSSEAGTTAADPETPSETRPASHPAIPESDPARSDVILFGCQETPVGDDGVYAVRLLFTGDTYPFIYVYAEGGGVLRAEITRPPRVEAWERNVCVYADPPAGEAWLAYTFRDLSPDREYVFLVITPGGACRIRYQNGRFQEIRRE